MNALISIAMATYNGSKYMKEQLDSIYAQTYKNFEVIVVDDLSTDETVQILEQYKRKYGLTYFVNDKNMGVTKNFEKAISLCKGEYIALVDQDDIWLPEKIEVLYENIGAASLIYSNAGIVNAKSEIQNKTAKSIYPLYELDSNTRDLYKYIVLHSFILGCSTMFKKELLPDLIPIYQTKRNHDWFLTVCAYNNNGIKYIDEVLFYYRHHNNNYSRGNGETIFQSILGYFSEKSISSRKAKILEQYKIVVFLLKTKKYLNNNDKLFLEDIKESLISTLKTTVHFKAFFISLKYKKVVFLNKNIFIKIINIFSKLVN